MDFVLNRFKSIPCSQSRHMALVLLLAAVFRLWGTYELNEFIEDETLHVSDAVSICTNGITENWGWHHPQLGGILHCASIRLFGNDPVGYRTVNVVSGTASVYLVFHLGKLLFPGTSVPLIAASLLAFDPHHIYLSRTTFTEIPVTCFFLLYLVLLLEHTERRRKTLPLAGIALGLTMATKAYYVVAIPFSILYAFLRIHRDDRLDLPTLFDISLSLIGLSGAVWLLSYLPWFGRGHSIMEFVLMKSDAVWALQHNTTFLNREFLEAGGRPWEWFVKPLFWGHRRLIDTGEARFLLQCNNPPFRMLVLPALSFVVARSTNRTATGLFSPILFLATYSLMLFTQRPMFSYSSAPLLPFAYMTVGQAYTSLFRSSNGPNYSTLVLIGASALWTFYLFPLISARVVPIQLYTPILGFVRYMGDF